MPVVIHSPHHAPPAPLPRFGHGDAVRARLEQDDAYRELRRGELLAQQIGSDPATPVEARYAAQLVALAASLYHTSHIAYGKGEYRRAAEYAVAVKDLMRAVDKLHNAAGGERWTPAA